MLKESKVDVPVFSIGNITVGGTGKTPMVIYVTKLLKNAGYNPGILSRGYGRDTKGYQLVSKEDKPLMDVTGCGDEIYLATDECGVPAAVSEKRVPGARKLLADTGVDSIVLDDAFQHRWIKRDMNILLFDQRFLIKKRSAERTLLPLGIMRETFSSVRRADVVVINRKFSEKKEISDNVMKHLRKKELYYANYKISGMFDVKDHHRFEFEEFVGQKSVVVCGIAKPHSFLKILEDNNIDIKNRFLFGDHKYYTHQEIQQIRKLFYESNANCVITTQKDAVKLTHFARELDDIDIYYLGIDVELSNQENFNEKIINIAKQY